MGLALPTRGRLRLERAPGARAWRLVGFTWARTPAALTLFWFATGRRL